jgi:hypothetical protein
MASHPKPPLRIRLSPESKTTGILVRSMWAAALRELLLQMGLGDEDAQSAAEQFVIKSGTDNLTVSKLREYGVVGDDQRLEAVLDAWADFLGVQRDDSSIVASNKAAAVR